MQLLLLTAALLPTLTFAVPNPHGDNKHAAHQKLHQHAKAAAHANAGRSIRVAKGDHHEARSQQAGQGQQSTQWGPPGDTAYSNDDYVSLAKKHHDYHRANHLASFIEWDPQLAWEAQQIANSCVYAHNQQLDPEAGQNIAAGYDASRIGEIITGLWYNNEQQAFAPNYGMPTPNMQNFELFGHLTQICWGGTTHFGCATASCPNGLANVYGNVEPFFTVCQYKEAGNVDGEYAQNVQPPQGAPQISGSTPLEYTGGSGSGSPTGSNPPSYS